MGLLTVAAISVATAAGPAHAGASSGDAGVGVGPAESIKPLQSSGAGNILDCQRKSGGFGRPNQESGCDLPQEKEGARANDGVLPTAIKDLSNDSEVSHLNIRQKDGVPGDQDGVPRTLTPGAE